MYSLESHRKGNANEKYNIHFHVKINQEGQDGPVSPPDYQIGFSVQEKFNIHFQEGGHLGFPIRTFLATFDLHDTSVLQ